MTRPVFVILEYGVGEGSENPTNHKTIPHFHKSDEHMSKIVGVIKKYQKEDFRIVSIPLMHAERWLKDNYKNVIVLSASVGGFLSHSFLRQYKNEFYMACSAGNEGAEGEAEIASYGYFTPIGAVSEKDFKPEKYSSFGKGLVEFAGLISNEPIEYTYKGKLHRERLFGTSYSCPQHATEIANLMTGYFNETGKKMRIGDVLAIRNENALDVYESGIDLKTGRGVYIYNPSHIDKIKNEKEEVLMKAKDFVSQITDIVSKPTIYALGGIGQMLNQSVINDICGRIDWNKGRQRLYEQNIGRKYVFDCVGLIKAVLWNWTPDIFNYAINGVPDLDANMMIDRCALVEKKNLIPGCVCWMQDHIGVYIGNSKVVEATPIWKDGVQITNIEHRNWVLFGKLPWVDYTVETAKRKENTEKMYNTLDEVPQWAKPTIKKLIDSKALRGNEKGELKLNDVLLRVLVINDRMGLYDQKKKEA